eukprot:5261548-Amphidinium_carterae.1
MNCDRYRLRLALRVAAAEYRMSKKRVAFHSALKKRVDQRKQAGGKIPIPCPLQPFRTHQGASCAWAVAGGRGGSSATSTGVTVIATSVASTHH